MRALHVIDPDGVPHCVGRRVRLLSPARQTFFQELGTSGLGRRATGQDGLEAPEAVLSHGVHG
jgi:hypothetical protein